MNKIGFIGTGLMGFPMAKNLLKSGFNLKVYNRSINKAQPLVEFGAKISKNVGDVVKDNDFIITMLTDDTAVDAIMNSLDFLDNLKSGSTVIDMSSVKPTTAKKYENILKLKTFATADSATYNLLPTGSVIFVSDGNAGNPCLAVKDSNNGFFRLVQLGGALDDQGGGGGF